MSANLSKNLNEQKHPVPKKEPLKLKQKIAIGFLAAASVAFLVFFCIFPDCYYLIFAIYWVALLIFNCLYNSQFTAETTVYFILCGAVTFAVQLAFWKVKRNQLNFETSMYAHIFLITWISYSFLYNIKQYKHNKLYTQTVEGTFNGYHEYEVSDADDIHPHTYKMYQRIWQFEFGGNVYTVKGKSESSQTLKTGTKQKLSINPNDPQDFSESGRLYGKNRFIRAWVIGIIPLAVGIFMLLDMMGII